MNTNETEALIHRLDEAQVESAVLLLNARRALQEAIRMVADAEARAKVARDQVAEVTAECDVWRAKVNAMRDTLSVDVMSAKSVPRADNPNP